MQQTVSSVPMSTQQADMMMSPQDQHRRSKPQMVGKYIMGKKIGSGNYSTVRICEDTKDHSKWAMKIVDKERMQSEGMVDQIAREVDVLKSVQHPNVVKLHDVLQSKKHIYLILELVTGGELFDKIVESKQFDEPTARRYFIQLLTAMEYFHASGFAHRDIKPENLLLDENENIKISDFGLCNRQTRPFMMTVCGTPHYVAPEVLREQGYNGLAGDMWSCGVVLYVMLVGKLPFDDQNMNVLIQKIVQGDYVIPHYISPLAADLLRHLMMMNPNYRFTVQQALAHPWCNM